MPSRATLGDGLPEAQVKTAAPESARILVDPWPERSLMLSRSASLLVLLAGLATACAQAAAPQQANGVSDKASQRIVKEVRHELLMLPYLDVFDFLAYKVNGYDVTLMGQVTRPTLKSDAEAAVKTIEGVEKIDNQIEVLPPSPMDDRLRLALYRAIYGFPSLQKYALGVQKPIRIIVKSGHVTLEGVVDNQADKNTAGIRANGVSGVFSVANNLQVVGS
jgi:hyperosmotically inducible periplasmic protein